MMLYVYTQKLFGAAKKCLCKKGLTERYFTIRLVLSIRCISPKLDIVYDPGVSSVLGLFCSLSIRCITSKLELILCISGYPLDIIKNLCLSFVLVLFLSDKLAERWILWIILVSHFFRTCSFRCISSVSSLQERFDVRYDCWFCCLFVKYVYRAGQHTQLLTSYPT